MNAIRGPRLTLDHFLIHSAHYKLSLDLWLLVWLASLLQGILVWDFRRTTMPT